MIGVENECVDCGLPCLYESCKYYKVVRYYCDCCNDEVGVLYYFDEQELCIDCIERRLERVKFDG